MKINFIKMVVETAQVNPDMDYLRLIQFVDEICIEEFYNVDEDHKTYDTLQAQAADFHNLMDSWREEG